MNRDAMEDLYRHAEAITDCRQRLARAEAERDAAKEALARARANVGELVRQLNHEQARVIDLMDIVSRFPDGDTLLTEHLRKYHTSPGHPDNNAQGGQP